MPSTRVLSTCLAALALCAATTTASTRAAAQARGLPITVPNPANDYTTFGLVSRLLADAGIPYGLEGPEPDAARASIDFARRTESVTFSFDSMEDALTRIAAVNPRMRWSRQGGMVVVRFGPARDGFLDRAIARFALDNASPRGALEAVLAAVDPSRPPGLGVQGAGRPPAGREGDSGARRGAPIAVSLKDTTVLDVLNAIATANGAMSWTITYDGGGRARYDTASIQFIEGGYRVTAAPKASLVAPPPGMSIETGPPVAVPVSGDLRTMLQVYSQQTGVRFGMEQARVQPADPRATLIGVPPLTFPPGGSPDAVARIVALDSRYEWSERRGFFRIRPKAGTPGRLDVLDRPQKEFVAAGDAIDDVLDRVMSMITGQPPVPMSLGLSFGSNRLALSRMVPVTFTTPDGASIADVLDALCLADGRLSWQIVHPVTPYIATVAQSSLMLSSSLGWTSSRGIHLNESATRPAPPPAAVPSSEPRHALPSSIDRTIGRLPVSFSPTPGAVFVALAAFAGVQMGIEAKPALAPEDDPRTIRRPSAMTLGPGTFGDALHVLLERLPDYSLDTAGPILSVAPAGLRQSPTHFMNVPLDRFEVRDVSIYRAVSMLRQRLNPGYVVAEWSTAEYVGPGMSDLQKIADRSRALYSKRVSLSVTNATPREILNRLVAAHGELSWFVSYEFNSPSVPVRVEEATWVIRLVPFGGSAFIAELNRVVASTPTIPR